MQDLLADLIDSARARADYADARFVHHGWRGWPPATAPWTSSTGRKRGHRRAGPGGRRVGLRRGPRPDRRDAEEALARALVAEAQPAGPRPRRSRPSRRLRARGQPAGHDPFGVALEEKLEPDRGRRRAAGRAGRERHGRPLLGVPPTRSSPARGRALRAGITECGGGITAVAVDGTTARCARFPPRTAATSRPDTALPRTRAAGPRREWPRRPWRCPRAGLPAGADDADTRRRAARPSGP